MFANDTIWTSRVPLAERSFFADWDYFASNMWVLRQVWQRDGVIPRWTYELCGGRPELANPQSFAYTWPSLFVYAFHPYVAMIVLWVVMTLLGAWCTARLLKRWCGDGEAAALGGCLYAISGYFAAHFNQGHLTFAFFHLIPALMLAAENALDAMTATPSKSALGPRLLFIATTFILFTAALPHGIFYFYPAFVLAMLVFGWERHRRLGARATALAYARLGLDHGLGIALAAYKLVPIAAWQHLFPRRGVFREHYSLIDTLSHTWRWIESFIGAGQMFPKQVWGIWEYHAFIGPLPWLAALAVMIYLVKRQAKQGQLSCLNPLPAIFGLTLVGLGINLALGNQHPLSLAQLFHYFPILEGIRVFGRYMILAVFGFAILSAYALALVKTRRSVMRPWLRVGLWAGVMIPALLQASLLVWHVYGRSFDDLRTAYHMRMSQAQTQWVIQDKSEAEIGMTHQMFLLQHNLWVANCYEPLTVGNPFVSSRQTGSLSPLSNGLLQRAFYEDASTLQLALKVPWWLDETKLSLSVTPFDTPWPPTRFLDHERYYLETPLRFGQQSLTLSSGFPYDDLGGLISTCALAALFLWFLPKRKRRS